MRRPKRRGAARTGGTGVPEETATSAALLRDDLEVDRRDDEVRQEQQHEADDDALVDGVADALRAALGVEALVGRDEGGDQPEDERFDLADDEVGDLRECREAGEVGAGRTALQDDVEE